MLPLLRPDAQKTRDTHVDAYKESASTLGCNSRRLQHGGPCLVSARRGRIWLGKAFHGKGSVMNKQELVTAIMENSGDISSKAAAGRILDTVISSITSGLRSDGQVQLIGFGSFSVKKRAKRKGRNPRTGEEITIKASKTVGFKCGKSLKETISKPKKRR